MSVKEILLVGLVNCTFRRDLHSQLIPAMREIFGDSPSAAERLWSKF